MRTDKEIKTLANGPHRDEGLITETTDRRNDGSTRKNFLPINLMILWSKEVT